MSKKKRQPWYAEGQALGTLEEQIFILLAKKGPTTAETIAERVSCSRKLVNDAAHSLISKRLIRREIPFQNRADIFWLTKDGILFAVLYGIEIPLLLENDKKFWRSHFGDSFAFDIRSSSFSSGELEILSILGHDVLKIGRSFLRNDQYADFFIPAFIFGVTTRSDYVMPERWSKIEQIINTNMRDKFDADSQNMVHKVDKAMFTLRKLRKMLVNNTKLDRSYEGPGAMSELLEKVDNAFGRNSLEKLESYANYLREVYKRRIKSEKRLVKLLFLATLRTMVDMEILHVKRKKGGRL